MKILGLVIGFVIFLSGCPGQQGSDGPVDMCDDASVGVQCRLEPGKLGVCSMRTSGELYCASQH